MSNRHWLVKGVTMTLCFLVRPRVGLLSFTRDGSAAMHLARAPSNRIRHEDKRDRAEEDDLCMFAQILASVRVQAAKRLSGPM
jgi:hypothetical protein